MARRVYFAFHYQRDIFRVNVVRNSWVTKDREVAGFFDAGLWERSKLNGDEAIKALIRNGLDNTSVTAVLIGAETSSRRWVDFEIIESYNRGNGLLGVYIDGIQDIFRRKDIQGNNPFEDIYFTNWDGTKIFFSQKYITYYWILDNGYQNFGNWVEYAATTAGK